MIDWTKSMSQTFEYYIVDPVSWRDTKDLRTVKSSSITRDSGLDTLGSASLDLDGSISECYVRIYLIVTQDGVTYPKIPLATVLVQTPSTSFDGKKSVISADAYTPLIELKENPPPIGFYIDKNTPIMDRVYQLTCDNLRANVVKPENEDLMPYNFIASPDENWLDYLKAAMANARHQFTVDPMGTVLFEPIISLESMQPIYTFNDDNSSILYPSITVDHDIYGIPNVVEVIYSGEQCFHSKAVNDDPSSPTSTVNRGRVITKRITDPDIAGEITQIKMDDYAKKMLKDLSSVVYTVSYSHAYCPVTVGDCVRLNYKRAGIKNVKAKIISQNIECTPGCKVTETASFVEKLWG